MSFFNFQTLNFYNSPEDGAFGTLLKKLLLFTSTTEYYRYLETNFCDFVYVFLLDHITYTDYFPVVINTLKAT